MFETYETIREWKDGKVVLVRDTASGTLAVRRRVPKESAFLFLRLSELSHPNLQKVCCVSEEEDTCCVFCSYVEGSSLAEKNETTCLTRREAVRVLCCICDAASFLHRQKPPVIHRDIKPENIILKEDGSAVLIDPGAARFYRTGAQSDTYAIGTRGYAAPEQYGFRQSDARTDIYAIGVVADELFYRCGAQKMYAHVIRRATGLNPRQRYSSVRQFRRALRFAPYRRFLLPLFLLLGAAALAVGLHFAARPKNAVLPEETVQVPQTVTERSETVSVQNTVYDPTHVTVSDASALAALCKDGDPSTCYEVYLESELRLEEDLTVPSNVYLIVLDGGDLRVTKTLTNDGLVRMERGGTLTLEDGAVLDCGAPSVMENGERNVPSVIVFPDGACRIEKNTVIQSSITGGDGDMSLLDIRSADSLSIEDASALTVKPCASSAYISIVFSDPAQVEQFDFSPFLAKNGKRSPLFVGFAADTRETLLSCTAIAEKIPVPVTIETTAPISLENGDVCKLGETTYLTVQSLELQDGAELTGADGSCIELRPAGLLRVHGGAVLDGEQICWFPDPSARIAAEEGAILHLPKNADLQVIRE